MKKNVATLIFASLMSLALGNEKISVRDPFWPIGYEPPPPASAEPVIEAPQPVIPEPESPKPQPPKPVTDEEWKMARKLLKVNGYAVGVIDDAGKRTKTSRVIINLKHYSTGEKIKLTHDMIDFVWTVGPIANNSVELLQESAVRIEPDEKVSPKAAPQPNPVKIIRE